MFYRLCLISSLLGLAACGRTRPELPTGNGSRPTVDRRSEPGRESVISLPPSILVPDADVRHYLTTLTAALELQADTPVSRAAVKTTLEFHVALSRTEPSRTRLTGMLTQMSTEADGLPESGNPVSFLPLRFTGYVEHGGLLLDSLAGAPVSSVVDCRLPELNAMASIQRGVVIPPLHLSTGTTWTDSSTVPACSGFVQLSLTAVRTYTVAGQTYRGSIPVIVVERVDRVTASGEGAQGQHRVSILSQGSGSARIYLDRTSGLLHESEGSQTVDLVIGSSGRSQRFRQVVTERIRLQR